jgi:hypothetical protein
LYNASTEKLSALPAQPAIGSTHHAAVIAAGETWLRWYASIFDELTPGEQPPWNAERMEYEFVVAAPPLATGEGEVVLEAPEYVEGRLDWHAFDVRHGAALGATATAAGVVPRNPSLVKAAAIPTPVRYAGMPSSGWFEMEDARVNFGAVDAAAEDIARMLVTDFALAYSDDWFLMPLELEVGSVCRIRALTITDTFGVTTSIPHYAAVDTQPSGWSIFSNAPADTAATDWTRKNIFFLPPTLNGAIESRPVEEVLFLRDEVANMAWAVERVVEGASGSPVDRFQLAQARRRREQEATAAARGTALAPLAYRLVRNVPEHWIPLAPQRVVLPNGRASIRLRKARMLDGTSPTPRGRILEPDQALTLFDETVPRAGARVMRSYQLARWTSGSTHLWTGRRITAGLGEGSSGLQFDLVEPLK